MQLSAVSGTLDVFLLSQTGWDVGHVNRRVSELGRHKETRTKGFGTCRFWKLSDEIKVNRGGMHEQKHSYFSSINGTKLVKLLRGEQICQRQHSNMKPMHVFSKNPNSENAADIRCVPLS